MQAEWQPEFPLLYSQRGFRYADLILTPAERAAWQSVLLDRASASPVLEHFAGACGEAERRATQTLEWGRKYRLSLHGIAIDHLTLARSRMYRALLEAHTIPDASRHLPDCATALAKLREANALHMLPLALLTAAFHAGALLGQAEEARRYLAEAQQIAERGPMPLHLADVHLHRARLFRDTAELTKAARLIRELGYGRRSEELADAEDAAKGW